MNIINLCKQREHPCHNLRGFKKRNFEHTRRDKMWNRNTEPELGIKHGNWG